MARVNISVPDNLAHDMRMFHLKVSAICQQAINEQVELARKKYDETQSLINFFEEV